LQRIRASLSNKGAERCDPSAGPNAEEIELVEIKATLDAKMAVLKTQLKAGI
jgi:hypothetical protein